MGQPAPKSGICTARHNMLKDLIHIVGSGFDDIDKLNLSGVRWAKSFQEYGLIKSSHTILDFGAGLGRISIPFGKLCKRVMAIDGNPEMVAYLKSKGVEAYLGTDCSVLPKPVPRFDFIVTAYVLQHMPWQKAVALIGQFSELTDVLFFTYPVYEHCSASVQKTYSDPATAQDLPVTESHNGSRIIHVADIPKLLAKSSFDSYVSDTRVVRNMFMAYKKGTK